jgi:hypothetical protein
MKKQQLNQAEDLYLRTAILNESNDSKYLYSINKGYREPTDHNDNFNIDAELLNIYMSVNNLSIAEVSLILKIPTLIVMKFVNYKTFGDYNPTLIQRLIPKNEIVSLLNKKEVSRFVALLSDNEVELV